MRVFADESITVPMSKEGLEALERVAATMGLTPDVLARKLITTGLPSVMASYLKEQLKGLNDLALRVLPAKGEA